MMTGTITVASNHVKGSLTYETENCYWLGYGGNG